MKKFTALFMSVVLFLSTISVSVFNIQPFTVYADESAWPKQPSVVATSACLIEASTGTVLYEKKLHKKMYPASITKILTALVTLENADLNEEVEFSEAAVNSVAPGDAHMEMHVGEVMSVEDCLYGLMLKSANEVAVGLAEHVAGSVKDFAKMMNERAVKAGATDSNFVNPNGLHDENHFITAYDMAMITRDAVKNPIFLSITGSTTYTVNTNKKKDFVVYQRHRMVKPTDQYYYEGILGGKTGYTDQSGTTLVSYAKRNGMTLICVVLNSNSTNSYEDTTKLFNYGFDNFNLVKPADNDTRFQTDSDSYRDMLTPVFGTNDNTTLSINSDDNIVIPKKASFSDVTSNVSFDISSDSDNPVSGAKVADIIYNYNGHDVGVASVVYSSDNKSGTVVSTDTQSSGKEVVTTQQTKQEKKQTKSHKSLSKSTIKKIVIAIILIVIIIIVIILIRKKQKKLNEIRARKRNRSY